MPARAIGSGTVSFGLVSIPVKLYTTNQPAASISFNMVHASCGTRLKQQYHCPTDDQVVPREEIAKGYEFAKGQYVVLSNDEVKALEAVSDNAIELTEFVPEDKIDPVFFDRAYYLGPDKGGDRAYALLSRAMQETGLVGLAKYSARGKQYLVLVRPHGDLGLAMHQLRYADEVKSFDEVPVSDVEIKDGELSLAKQIIEQIANGEFHPEQYRDEVKDRVQALIAQKIEGAEITTAAPEAPRGQIIDLMEALKASLGSEPKKAARAGKDEAKPAARSSRKPTRGAGAKEKKPVSRRKKAQ